MLLGINVTLCTGLCFLFSIWIYGEWSSYFVEILDSLPSRYPLFLELKKKEHFCYQIVYDWFLITAARVTTSFKYCSCFLFTRLQHLAHLLHKNKIDLLTMHLGTFTTNSLAVMKVFRAVSDPLWFQSVLNFYNICVVLSLPHRFFSY